MMAKVGIFVFLIMLQLEAREKVIFGEDNRKDLFETPKQLYKVLARSTAGMIAKKDIIQNLEGVTLRALTLKQTGVCSSEKFATQPTPTHCTGFLVAPNVLATAGHCLTTVNDCKDYAWVFNYRMIDKNRTSKITKNNIYNCKKIISHAWDVESGIDHALIELDRPVKNRKPLKFRRSGTVSYGDELAIIGHPAGLPLKVADGAIVKSLDVNFFVANLDAYSGNSGAPVFNAKTGVVEGILARGEEDYINTPKKCKISNRLPNEGESGEDVTFITNIKELGKL